MLALAVQLPGPCRRVRHCMKVCPGRTSRPAQRHDRMERCAAFLERPGVDPHHARAGRKKVQRDLPVLTAAQDAAVLREAGFQNIQLFYAAFAFCAGAPWRSQRPRTGQTHPGPLTSAQFLSVCPRQILDTISQRL